MSTAKEIEVSMEHAQEVINRAKALDRLHNNPDFLDVIRDGFLHEEAIRLVHLKAGPNMQKPEHQADIIKAIDAIGGLIAYFQKIEYAAKMAESAIEQAEQALLEIEQEELQGEDE